MINILGTDYEYKDDCDEKDYPLLEDREAYTDSYKKQIIITNRHNNNKTIKDKIKRHEIVHAFLYESGLDCNTDWATNEEMVDWFAIQFPKLQKIYKELDIEE